MLYVGIDTGDKTGFAVWDSQRREFLAVGTLPIHRAMMRVNDMKNDGIVVIIEDARLRKWIPRERSNAQYRGRLMGAGSIKRDANIWEDFLTDIGVEFHMIPPQKGATKYTPEQFRRLTGYDGRTSNHARDAALLVFGR